MPQISVIMNCLNGEKYLPQALECLKKQTFQDFEIIFWDNGSTDASPDIAKAYGERLRFFQGRTTAPLGAARNLAIEKAQGTYIAFLDCDDLWRPEKLEKQIALMQANPLLGLVTTNTEIFDGKKVLYRLFDQAMPARGKVFRELMQRQWISMSSAFASKAALDAVRINGQHNAWFDEKLNLCEEADLFYRIAHDYELDFVDEPLTVWRIHPGSTTFQKFDRFADETMAILERQRAMYPDYDAQYADIAMLLTKRSAFQKAVAFWRAGRNAEARRTISPYLATAPKYRLFWLASFLPGSFFDLAAKLYFMLPKNMRG